MVAVDKYVTINLRSVTGHKFPSLTSKSHNHIKGIGLYC